MCFKNKILFYALPVPRHLFITQLLCSGLSHTKHRLVDVTDCHRRRFARLRAHTCGGGSARRVQKAEGDVAGATGHVQQASFRPGSQTPNEGVLPHPVNTQGHGVVHQVVGVRHAVEHPQHRRLFLLLAQTAEPEVGLLLVGVGGGCGCGGGRGCCGG